MHRLTVAAPSVVTRVLFVTSWTRVAFRCTRAATVGDRTLFFPCSSVILLKFWDHVVNEAHSSDVPFIRLVPEHAASFRPQSSDRSRRPLFSSDALHCASDWVFLFDLEDALIFPPEIAATLQRPDIVIFSRALRQVILIELTVPLEYRVCVAHERKRNRYLPLLSLCQSNGWNATHFPVEVGSRGFVAYSLLRCLRQLGFPPYWAKKSQKWSIECFTPL